MPVQPGDEKRGQGEGSFRERPNGSWEARARIGGVQRSFYGRTKGEARAKMRKAMRQPAPATGGAITLGDWLTEWVASLPSRGLAYNTIRRYASAVRVHLIPALGDVRLDRLKRADVDALVARIRAAGATEKHADSVRQALAAALAAAMRRDPPLVSANVAHGNRDRRERALEVAPYTPEEARRFLAAIRGDRLEALYVVAIACGMREGEALGLRWGDVDLEAGAVIVRNQLQREPGRWVIKPTKGRKARTLSLPRVAIEALTAHRARQDEERASGLWDDAYTVWDETARAMVHPDLVFCEPTGRPIHATRLRLWFHALTDRAGLPRQHVHALRHCYASLLIARDLPVYDVSRMLGHSSTRVTEQVYVHLFDAARRRAADAVDDALSPDSEHG